MRRLTLAIVAAASGLAASCSSFGEAPAPGASPDGGAIDASTEAAVPDAAAPDAATAICQGGCPVASWSFDEPGGITLMDGSGNANHGVLVTAARAPGKVNGALLFDNRASTLKASVPSSPSLDVSGTNLSITFWVWLEPPDGGGDEVLFEKPWTEGKMDRPYYQYGVEWNAGRRALDLFLGEGVDDPVPASVSPPTGRWTHVAFVYDGARVLGYVDGATVTATALTTKITKRGTALRFGADATLSQAFGGKLDEVRIYDRVLSPAEVTRIARPAP